VALSPNPSPARWVVATPPWNLQPRKVEELPAANSPYAAAVRDFLARKGLRNPQVRLTRVLRADLNGNGRMELVFWDAFYEGYTLSVLEGDGKGFREALSTGCGA